MALKIITVAIVTNKKTKSKCLKILSLKDCSINDVQGVVQGGFMIVFSGIINDQLQDKTMKRRNKYVGKLLLFISFTLITLSGISLFFLNADMKGWAIVSAVLIAISLFNLFSPGRKLPFRWEFHISISKEEMIIDSPLWHKPLKRPIKKIKKILDVGDTYYIIFADITNCAVCQKNLIQTGTLEEFKDLFKDKIKVITE